MTRRFLEDLANHPLLESVSRLDRSLLVLHGTDDSTVSPEHGERLFAAAKQPKSFHGLPGADHLISGKDSLKTASRLFSIWLQGLCQERL